MSAFALTSLALHHFRSHRLARLSLAHGPVVIHGNNGAGKTNILEAVSLLSPGRGLRRATADEMARTPGDLGWKIVAEATGSAGRVEIETWSEAGLSRKVRLDDKTSTQLALGRALRVLWLVPAMDRLWTDGPDGRRRFLDRVALSFDPSHAEATLDYDRAMRERNRLLKDGATDAHWYRALEHQMARAGVSVDAARRRAIALIMQAQRASESAFPAAELALLGADGSEAAPWDAAALSAALADGRKADIAAGRALTGPHRSDLGAVYAAKGTPANRCSTGEQKALLLSLVLANARALEQEAGAVPVLLLDEVAAHLDANRRAALYSEILAMGCQAWMTGTDRALFEGLEGLATCFSVREANGDSTVEQEHLA